MVVARSEADDSPTDEPELAADAVRPSLVNQWLIFSSFIAVGLAILYGASNGRVKLGGLGLAAIGAVGLFFQIRIVLRGCVKRFKPSKKNTKQPAAAAAQWVDEVASSASSSAIRVENETQEITYRAARIC